MKIILLISILFTFQGCILHYDRLEYYVDGYSPNNADLSTEGYYYTSSDSSNLKIWPNAVIEMYFFKDGTFNYGSNVEHKDSLDKWICKYGEKYFRYGPFGFYTIKNDTIYVEYIDKDPLGSMQATRYFFKALKTPNGIEIVNYNGEQFNEDWLFSQNACVPDSIKNWIPKHRKYKLK